jgi:hypothetical protein
LAVGVARTIEWFKSRLSGGDAAKPPQIPFVDEDGGLFGSPRPIYAGR